MAGFTDDFLDDLRQRLKVSAVVGRDHELIKRGTEFVSKADPSISVNDGKGLWFDFGKGRDGGDIFQWMMQQHGMDFPGSVKACAEMAGVPLPANGDARPRARSSQGSSEDPPWHGDPPPLDPDDRAAPPRPPERKITKTYDYTDASGTLLYQVCRLEWDENGKHKKTFFQRRPCPDDDGSWIVGLKAGEFIKSKRGDWLEVNEDRADWRGERRTFNTGVPHGLYRLVEFKELATPDEPVWLPEGEKDADTLTDWGFVATTNSGGAGNFRPDHAEMFRGLDVIIPIDNDEAGHKRADKIGAALRGIARRVRVLDFAKVWPGAPKGADVTDWKRQREGDRDELMAFVPKLPDWTPPPFVSAFGGIPFERLDDPGPEHEFLIDDLLTLRDKSAIAGASRSGKSFLAIEAAGCIATGKDFFGHKVLAPGLVIYQAGEGAHGIKKRFRAWRQWYRYLPGDRIPIFILQSKIDIYRADGDTAKLIEEIKGIQQHYDMPLRALFIDTLAKAQGAADENNGKDMALVMGNVDKISDAFPNSHISLVHHFNAAGTKMRGHSSVYAGLDQVVLVTKEEGSKVRTAVLDKQKDGEDGLEIRFELFQVELGKRADDKPITSCVVLPIGGGSQARDDGKGGAKKGVKLSNERAVILRSLIDALAEKGEKTPPHLRLPRAITTVITKKLWKQHYLTKLPDVGTVADNTINKRMRDALAQFLTLKVVGVVDPYVWVTGKLVQGVVELPPPGQLPEGGYQQDMLNRGPEPNADVPDE
jgi:hypothetical protein